MQGYKSEYERYLLISGNCKYLQGTYPNFLKFKDLIG